LRLERECFLLDCLEEENDFLSSSRYVDSVQLPVTAEFPLICEFPIVRIFEEGVDGIPE